MGAPPGIQMCKPFWNHVAYMVTQQSCTYNAPVKSCPTKDNVMVDCELTLVFAIGPDPVDVKNFVYNLGALKFNEFLAAECEEAIRQLIRVTALNDVYELRGSSSQHVQNVLKVLDDKFKEFGVHACCYVHSFCLVLSFVVLSFFKLICPFGRRKK